MRLLFILENPHHVGGGDYYVYMVADALRKSGHEVTIFTKARNGFMAGVKSRFSFDSAFKGYGLLNRAVEQVHTRIFIERYISKNRPDMIVGYLRDAAIKAAVLGKKHGIKVLNFVFECPPWMEKDLGEKWFEDYKGKMVKSWEDARRAYLASDHLIAISQTSKKENEAWLGKKIDAVAYPGIDHKLYDSIKTEKKNQVICIGRFDRFKNTDKLMTAMDGMKTELVLVGDGPERKRLMALAHQLSISVRFCLRATEDEKIKELKSSRLLIHPAGHEGFGMPPLEALYCQVPCLCSDLKVFHEVYGDHVSYFKDDLKEQIAECMNNPMKPAQRTKAHKYASGFSWEKTAKIVEATAI